VQLDTIQIFLLIKTLTYVPVIRYKRCVTHKYVFDNIKLNLKLVLRFNLKKKITFCIVVVTMHNKFH